VKSEVVWLSPIYWSNSLLHFFARGDTMQWQTLSGARARALYPHLDRALVARKILQAIARLDR